MNNAATEIITEDGCRLAPGAEAYNYYDMKPGRIPDGSSPFHFSYYADGADAQRDIWFKFQHTDGTSCILNGQRICTMEFARRRGFPGA